MTEITDPKDNPTGIPDGYSDHLMYLSLDDRALVAQYQRTLTVPTLDDLIKIQGTIEHTTLNRRGRPIHNWARFMLYVIQSLQ